MRWLGNVIALLRAPAGHTEFPVGEALEPDETAPRMLERWGVWITIVFILIAFAYTAPVLEMLGPDIAGSPGYRTW